MKNFISLLIAFLFYNSIYAQEVIIKNKKFNGLELERALRKIPGRVAMVDCEFTLTPGLYTPSGIDDATIMIPKEITYISFNGCKFSDLHGIIVEDVNTGIDIYTATLSTILAGKQLGLSHVNLKFLNTILSQGDSIRYQFDDVKIENVMIRGAFIAELSIYLSTLGELRFLNCDFTTSKLDKFSFGSLPDDYEFFEDFHGDSLYLTNWEKDKNKAHIDHTVKIYPNYRFTTATLFQNQISSLSIEHSKFDRSIRSVLPIYNCHIEDFRIAHCNLGSLDLYNSSVQNNFLFEDAELAAINLYKCQLPASNVSGFTFDKLRGGKVYAFDPVDVSSFSNTLKTTSGPDSILLDDHRNETSRWATNDVDTLKFMSIVRYNGYGEGQIKNDFLFSELINNYSKLYKIYRERGDLQSSNACYAEMKDLLTDRLRSEYNDNSTFKNFFDWQLAWLVKVYTNHGTDPALAMNISFWIIFAFAIFYFFFPSDWDLTSKSKMISNYRMFIEKNEKGYFKPFLTLTGGVLLSFVNALTLSLNAYTTLGFGNIPTHGLARYACVVQGFIGWFMLSIFTVALINQVLT